MSEIERRPIWTDYQYAIKRKADGYWLCTGGWLPVGNCVLRFEEQAWAENQANFNEDRATVDVVPIEITVREVGP